MSIFCQQRIIVIGCYIRCQNIIIICTIHKAKICPSVCHINIHASLLQNIIEVLCMLDSILHMMNISPGIKPANPEFHTHQRLVSNMLFQYCKLFFCFGAKISRLQYTLHFSAGQIIPPWAIRSNKRHLHTILQHHLFQAFQIVPIVSVSTVFILYLKH